MHCSHPQASFRLCDIPEGMRKLLEQHGEEEYDFTSEEPFKWDDILRTFCTCSKIYGYLSSDYMAKWKQTLCFIESVVKDQEDGLQDNVWVLFFCTDYDIVYSISWNRAASKVEVLAMSPYMHNPDVREPFSVTGFTV